MSLASVFIPRVSSKMTTDMVSYIFQKQELGNVKRVDLVAKMDKRGIPYNAAYVHINNWFINPASLNFQERIENGKEARIVYDDPKYWVVLKNTAQKPEMLGGRKVRINLNEVEQATPSFTYVSEDYIKLLRKQLKDLQDKKNNDFLNFDVVVNDDNLPMEMPYLVRDDGYECYVSSDYATELEQKVLDMQLELELLRMIEMDEIDEVNQREEDYKYERKEIIMGYF
jgi:hypothetical protein